MELIERYLHAIRFWLPRSHREDVAAELAEDIRSQIEEREGKLGRPLTEPEIAALLQQRGRPMLVASRYRPQQYLIGPALFPAYRFVVVIVALVYLAPWLLTWGALALFDPSFHMDLGRTFGPPAGTFWVAFFVALGAVTLVFAILERVEAKSGFLRNWNPLKLPPVRQPHRIPRVNSAIELAANLVFIVWWVTDMWSPTIFALAGLRVVFAPGWTLFLWIFLLIALANILLAITNLVRPYWTWPRACVQLSLTIAGAVAFCALVRANLLAEIIASNLPSAQAAHIVRAINSATSRSFPVVVAVCALIVAITATTRIHGLRTRPRPTLPATLESEIL